MLYNISTMSAVGERDVGDEEGRMVRAAQADHAAFGPLYERYVDRVHAYLRARTGDPDDAADLTQQVFLRALDALPRYRIGRTPVAAWIFRIARNVAVDFHRRRRDTVTWDLVPEALEPVALDDPFAAVIQTETLERLRARCMALDPGTRELLALRFAASLTIAEIAAVVGASKGATQMRLVRALRTLKESYHDYTL